MTENRASGGYRVFSLLDPRGPEPAAGPVLHARHASAWGEGGDRPFLPRAISVAETAGRGRGAARLPDRGDRPRHRAALRAGGGEGVWVNGPLGNAFAGPGEVEPGRGRGDPGRRWHRRRAAGDAAPPPRRAGRPAARPARLPQRDALGRPRRALLATLPEVRLASEDGHAGHRGYVTDLLAAMLAGDDAESAVVYSCGPPAMLEAVRSMCAERGVACELAMESPMACGFGACFGCAVPSPRAATCASASTAQSFDGEQIAEVDPCLSSAASSSTHPVINASGTYDAIAARRVFGDELLEDFPFSAFVSKTITPEPRTGNAPQRIWETPAGMINSIGLPNKGLDGFLAEDLPQLAELPVPLIVSVMGTSREEFARLVEGVGGA